MGTSSSRKPTTRKNDSSLGELKGFNGTVFEPRSRRTPEAGGCLHFVQGKIPGNASSTTANNTNENRYYWQLCKQDSMFAFAQRKVSNPAPTDTTAAPEGCDVQFFTTNGPGWIHPPPYPDKEERWMPRS